MMQINRMREIKGSREAGRVREDPLDEREAKNWSRVITFPYWLGKIIFFFPSLVRMKNKYAL